MDPKPDPTPDPTLRIEKNNIFCIFLSFYLPAITFYSVLKLIFLQKFCVKILFCKHYLSPLNTFVKKGKDPEPDPDPYLWIMDLDPGVLTTSGSGSPTLTQPVRFFIHSQ